MVVVTHGPELHAFAKENYKKYQGIMDRMKELADDGGEFRMCHNALRAAGFEADDFHGFITVVPAGFPEFVYLQSQGPEHQSVAVQRQGRAQTGSARELTPRSPLRLTLPSNRSRSGEGSRTIWPVVRNCSGMDRNLVPE